MPTETLSALLQSLHLGKNDAIIEWKSIIRLKIAEPTFNRGVIGKMADIPRRPLLQTVLLIDTGLLDDGINAWLWE